MVVEPDPAANPVSSFLSRFKNAPTTSEKKAPAGRAAKTAQAKAQASSLAENVVETVNRLTMAFVDVAAGMTAEEKEAIEAPLAAMLADSDALAKQAKVVNPIALLFAVMGWGFKVWTIQTLKRQLLAAQVEAAKGGNLTQPPATVTTAPIAPSTPFVPSTAPPLIVPQADNAIQELMSLRRD